MLPRLPYGLSGARKLLPREHEGQESACRFSAAGRFSLSTVKQKEHVMDIDVVLFIIAAVCFGLAGFGWTRGKVNLMALGLLAWVLTNLI